MVGKHIQSWLQSLSARVSPAPVSDLNDALVAVPPGVLNSLSEKMGQLPTPQPYQTTIQDAFTEALQAWQAKPDTTNNSLVVLSRPVEAIAPILKESFQAGWPNCNVQLFLGGYQRPPDPLTIPDHLRRELDPEDTADKETPSPPVTQTDLQGEVPTVMVIPSLEQCFLRCIHGWQGIEYLQNLATQDTSRFWVFGCNHWAWAFLTRVCQVNAYLEQVVPLPELTGEALQAWLSPIFETAVETPMTDGSTLQVEIETDAYWTNLVSLSAGIAATAAQMWRHSLRIRAEKLTDEGTLAADATAISLLQTKPSLPGLMTLEVMDRYLLHSLLIHGEMTRSHLALSLGEADRKIRSRVQVLKREGIILQQGRRLRVCPAHYPKLYSELGNNNFLIGKA
ncbi:MAG: MarR family transcriptional regulator [Leptolyngbya sp. SIO1E4]|nr:MarR family transcriptional regulator [Leptolyngbya sp. SIO1E4]